MTINPQTQKIFFSKVSHFFHFLKNPTYNLKPMFPISNEHLALRALPSLLSPLLCYCCFCCLTFFSESVPAAQRLHLKTYYLMKKNKKFA